MYMFTNILAHEHVINVHLFNLYRYVHSVYTMISNTDRCVFWLLHYYSKYQP